LMPLAIATCWRRPPRAWPRPSGSGKNREDGQTSRTTTPRIWIGEKEGPEGDRVSRRSSGARVAADRDRGSPRNMRQAYRGMMTATTAGRAGPQHDAQRRLVRPRPRRRQGTAATGCPAPSATRQKPASITNSPWADVASWPSRQARSRAISEYRARRQPMRPANPN
jgi:hypothetical protein